MLWFWEIVCIIIWFTAYQCAIMNSSVIDTDSSVKTHNSKLTLTLPDRHLQDFYFVFFLFVQYVCCFVVVYFCMLNLLNSSTVPRQCLIPAVAVLPYWQRLESTRRLIVLYTLYMFDTFKLKYIILYFTI